VNRPRVLLADDHQLVIDRVAALLEGCFEIVGAAHDGLELVLEAQRLTPDVIVADLSMPVLTGLEAVQELKKRGVCSRVVFLTVHDTEEFVEACMLEGALGFVTKSHVKNDLIPAINAAVAGKRFVSPSTVGRSL
jgi:DNA-binding NarL/FixJ family response regulator